MKLARRQFIRLSACAAIALDSAQVAWAQSYPTRPVRLIVPFQAGGQVDIIARVIAQWLSERLGQQFFVDNRPGGAGNIGTEAAVRSPADGHTLLLATVVNAVNATLFDKLSYEFVRDTVPVASINRIPLVLEVHPSFAAKSVSDLIAEARNNPGKINIATAPKGTAPFMAAQLFKMMGGIDTVHVPYRGTPQMLPDLLSGRVEVAFDGISSSIEHIRSGKLRPLAVTTTARLEALPELPTIAETIPGFEASGWCGVVAPQGSPLEIAEKLNNEINRGLRDPKIRTTFADVGITPLASSRADFGKLIADETDKLGKVVRFSGLKPD